MVYTDSTKITVKLEIQGRDNDGYADFKTMSLSNECSRSDLIAVRIRDSQSGESIEIKILVCELEKMTRLIEWTKSA